MLLFCWEDGGGGRRTAISVALPHKRVAILEIGQVGLVAVHETQVVLAADEQYGRVGTKAADLRQPHGLAVAQRFGIADGEAQQNDVGSIIIIIEIKAKTRKVVMAL